MSYNGSKVLYHSANVKSFLDIEVIEIFSFKCNGRVHLLFEYFWDVISKGEKELENAMTIRLTSTALNLFCIACKCHLSVLKEPIQLISLWTEVLNDIPQCPR